MSIKIFLLIVSFILARVNASPLHFIDVFLNGTGINYDLIGMKFDVRQQCDAQNIGGGFTVYDYSVVIGMLVISLGIGVFYGFFDKSSESSADFMLGHEMSLFPVTLSLTTSFITAIELLGNPSEIFFNGAQFSLIVISMLLVIPLAVTIFYPIYDKMKLTSCYEYLGLRFGKEMRIFGGSLYIIQMCFYTSVSVLAPSIALSKATGLNTRLAIVLIYIVCIFYSSQGGLKAIVIADTFQASVLFVSLILILIVGTYVQDGGIGNIFKTASEHGRLDILNFDPNPTTRHTVFSVIIGGFFYWSSLLCVNQATVQKAMSLRNLSKAKIALTLSAFGLVLVFLANFYTGLMMFAKYEKCDPLKAKQIDGIDQLVPFYVIETFKSYTFIVGLFVAGIFAASLGTVAAALSSLSAVTIEDLLVSGMNMKIKPEKGAKYAKWMNFGYGILSFALIFIVEGHGILQATLTLNGIVGGILLGLFVLGIFFKSANLKGALYGGLLAMVCVCALGVFALMFNDEEPFLESSTEGCNCIVNSTISSAGAMLAKTDITWYTSIYKISYMWYSAIGCTLTVLFGVFISVITQKYTEHRIRAMANSNATEKIGRFTTNSLAASSRKISAVVHHMANDVINHAHIPQLHHNQHIEDYSNIINEETLQGFKEQKSDHGKLFFDGLFDKIQANSEHDHENDHKF